MNNVISYEDALNYIYQFIEFGQTRTYRYSPERMNLSRMQNLLEALGNPHQQYPTIHVAGTKGKGSVSSFIANSLLNAGYKTGLYTSPHLVDYAERIRVDGETIPHAELVTLVNEVRPILGQFEGLTTFEITTALGFLYFAREKVDVAVIEVGLGGRIDATNVVTPVVSVITSLSLDHTHILGNTIEKIAAEKGGIIKPGIPVVTAPQKEEALQVIRAIAQERNAPLYQVGKDLRYRGLEHNLDRQTFEVWTPAEQSEMDRYIDGAADAPWRPASLQIPLLGYHQVINAVTAYLALQVANQGGMKVDERAIAQGFASVEWPCRFEVLQKGPPVVIDSAHNQDSAMRLRTSLDDYFPGKPVILVFGASEDKDIAGMFTELAPRVERIIATQSHHPRAIDANRLVELAHYYGCPVQAVPALPDALERALRLAGKDKVVLVTGSLFVTSDTRELWRNQQPRLEISD